MRKLTFISLCSFALTVAACSDSATPGASEDDTAGSEGECPVGSEDCPCTAGGACDEGLVCEENMCVPGETESGTSDDTTQLAVDRILVGSTVTGGVRRHGVRVATFVVDLSPAADGATRARFRVRWFLPTPAMVPFVAVDEEHSVALEPLRELSERLAERLQHPED